MKLTDRRLYQARNLEDFTFRFYFDDVENYPRRNAIRETNFYTSGSFVAPDTNRIWGVDVSGRWDGNVNFSVTAGYGGKFAIIKAMDGTIPTRYWRENNRRAYDAGLLNGPYAWLYPDNRVPCRLQAQAYCSLIEDEPMRLPPVIDFEWTRYAGVQADPNYDDLRKWLAEFIRVSGTKPILYSAAGYTNMFGPVPGDILDMLAGIWLASYGGTQPIYPRGITRWDMWQFTASGDALLLAPGDTGKKELDLNYMTNEFYVRYSGATEPQPGETTMARYEATNLYPDMSLREDHNTGSGLVQRYPAGVKWHGDVVWTAPADLYAGSVQINKAGDKWLQVSEVTGAARTGWVAITHMGREYCQLTEINPPQPQPVDEIFVDVNAEVTATINGAAYRGQASLQGVQLRPVE